MRPDVDSTGRVYKKIELNPLTLVALVVGIDHYQLGDAYHLPRPSCYALDFVDWLTHHNVPMSRIGLFLAKQSWADSNVQDWLQRQKHEVEHRDATREAIANFLDDELVVLDPQLVVVFWGGHGFIDDNQRQLVFTADAHKNAPHCMSIDDIVNSLNRDHLTKLIQHVCMIDACARPYHDYGEEIPHVRQSLAGSSRPAQRAEQIGCYAASPGYASFGKFSELLLKKLTTEAKSTWPDFSILLQELVEHPDLRSLGSTRPRIEVKVPGKAKTIHASMSPQLEQAIRTISQLENIQNTQLYRLYVRCLPQSADALPPAAGHVTNLEHLEDLYPRHPGYPGPLEEFMVRLHAEASSAALERWIDAHISVQARNEINLMLERECANAATLHARLFIEINPVEQHLRWYVQSPNFAEYSAARELAWAPPIATALPALLTHIVEDVEKQAMIGAFPLAVSLLLPHTHLTSNIEAALIKVQDDLGETSMPLLKRYPVLLHWLQRRLQPGNTARPSPPIESWLKLLTALSQQLSSNGTAAVKWLSPVNKDGEAAGFAGLAAIHLHDSQSVEVCIGLPYPLTGEPHHLTDMIEQCLRAGIPCMGWIADATVDHSAVRHEVSKEFARLTPSNAPIAMTEYIRSAANANMQGQALRLVWDDQAMLPAAGIFSTP